MSEQIEKCLEERGFFVNTTVGWSMYPMLRNRHDRVIITKLEAGQTLKKFDLPLYKRPNNTYILHRIIGVRDGYYLIRGDHTFCVEKVPKEWVLGVVQEFYRGEKHVMSDSFWYRAYARFWNFIYPIRWCHHVGMLVLRKIYRFLFKRKAKKAT